MEIIFEIEKIKPVHSCEEGEQRTDTAYILKGNASGGSITCTIKFKNEVLTLWKRVLGLAGDTVHASLGADRQQTTLQEESVDPEAV